MRLRPDDKKYNLDKLPVGTTTEEPRVGKKCQLRSVDGGGGRVSSGPDDGHIVIYEETCHVSKALQSKDLRLLNSSGWHKWGSGGAGGSGAGAGRCWGPSFWTPRRPGALGGCHSDGSASTP